MTALTDESIMPFGKHNGTKMANVPGSYLLFLLEEHQNKRNGPLMQAVIDYAKANKEVLLKENRYRK